MSDETIDEKRRDFLFKATATLTTIGVAAVATVPFIKSMFPSRAVEAAAKPIKVDLSQMKPGDQLTIQWRGKPIWIVRRTPSMVEGLPEMDRFLSDPDSKVKQQPDYAQNRYRSIKPEYLVLVGVCTHLGCAPTYRPDQGGVDPSWRGGFFCSCHGSKFDMAGRVFKGMPAPINLEVPPYYFIDDHSIVIGADKPKERV